MDAIAMFLYRHARLHRHVDRLFAGLGDEEIRTHAHPGANPLAWLIWHIARSEDASVSLLVCDTPPVLDDGWCCRLNVPQRGVGTGMTANEVMTISAKVHLPALIEYWQAVGEQTTRAVQSLSAKRLDDVVDSSRIHAAVEAMASGAAATPLEAYFRDTRRGQFLIWLALTHSYEHVGQADLLRGILGHVGNI